MNHKYYTYDYILGPTYFNQFPTLSIKNIHYGSVNDKKIVYNSLFTEINN